MRKAFDIPVRPSVGQVGGAQRLLDAPFPRNAEELLKLEERALKAGRVVSDAIVAYQLQRAHADRGFMAECTEVAKKAAPHPMRSSGRREVEIRLASGGSVTVRTPYIERDRTSLPGRRRGRGKRGANGSGMYPVLAQLGVAQRATPKVLLLSAYQLVTGDSYRASLGNLTQMGLGMTDRAMVRYSQHMARAFLERRDARLAPYLEQPACEGPLAGRVIQISVDGGRIKVRRTHKTGRRRKSGRRGFVTEWREPKGFIIQLLDEDGRPDKKVLPFIDFTLGDCEALFSILKRYLMGLGAAHAKRVVFIADGAEWIWNRAEALFKAVGVGEEKLVKLLDFYHACEYLNEASQAAAGWEGWEKQELYKTFKKWLRQGNHTYLFAKLNELSEESDAEPIKKALGYLSNHKDLLAYAKARRLRLPIGSGAIESAIRRVVNQRFKAPGTIWSEENVEPFLHLRALVKAGRFREASIDLLRSQDMISSQPDLQENDPRAAAA